MAARTGSKNISNAAVHQCCLHPFASPMLLRSTNTEVVAFWELNNHSRSQIAGLVHDKAIVSRRHVDDVAHPLPPVPDSMATTTGTILNSSVSNQLAWCFRSEEGGG